MMIKIDVITGFLGAGKTTFLKMLLEKRVFGNEKILIIENEFGDVPIDHHILENDKYTMVEISGGCICCSLKVDIIEALASIAVNEKPDRILMEPSGVFVVEDLFEIMKHEMVVDHYTIDGIYTMLDTKHFLINQMRYTHFYMSQLKYADHIIMSKVDKQDSEKIDAVLNGLESFNEHAKIYAVPFTSMTNDDLKEMFYSNEIQFELEENYINIAKTEKVSHTRVKSIGILQIKDFTNSQFTKLIKQVKEGEFGSIIRLKGYVQIEDKRYLVNYTFGELNLSVVENGSRMITVIGENMENSLLRESLLFSRKV